MNSSTGPRTIAFTTCRIAARRAAVALGLVLAAAGCGTTHRTVPLDDRDRPTAPSDGAPNKLDAPIAAGHTTTTIAVTPARRIPSTPPWLTEPLSKEKLRSIEAWLPSDGVQAEPEWRIEGELVLNLGRLELARRDAQEADADALSIASRLRTARAGLERVTSEIDATPAQRKRAQDGLKRAERALGQASAERGTTAAAAWKGLDVPLIGRKEWGAAPARIDRMEKNKAPYTRITVHHSADRDPPHLDGSLAASEAEMRQIQKAHLDGANTHYGDIGYHFVIDPFGRVLEGRELVYQGAHAYGDNNIQNLGVCLIGNFDEEHPTKAALDALKRVLDHLRKTYGIAKSRVYGHRDLRKTECPGDNLMRWLESYRK